MNGSRQLQSYDGAFSPLLRNSDAIGLRYETDSPVPVHPTATATVQQGDSVIVETRRSSKPNLLSLPQELRDMTIDLVYARSRPRIARGKVRWLSAYKKAPTNLPSVYRSLRVETERAYARSCASFWRLKPASNGSETHHFALKLHNAPSCAGSGLEGHTLFELMEVLGPCDGMCGRLLDVRTPCEEQPGAWRYIGQFGQYTRGELFLSPSRSEQLRSKLQAFFTGAMEILKLTRADGRRVKRRKNRCLEILNKVLLWVVSVDDGHGLLR